ncbi:MAG: deoxyribose-phosphate aldolase, partial [Acidimicrobiia bacterium]
DVLCDRAAQAGTAAVCVWPDFVALAADRLTGLPIAVATVVNFPTGDERPFAVGVLTDRALDDGADEIDVVLPYRAFAGGDRDRADAVLSTVRSATDGRALMKVILETGELGAPELVREAAHFAIEHGADFVKTSTGKSKVSATPEAARAMLDEIAAADRSVGLKPSGGIGSAADADTYLSLAEATMGADFLQPATFRFGASGVLDALLAVAGGGTSASSGGDTY